ncbi:MAG: hypothetical protein WC711_02825 [Candidatus Staskawiczbacteria bacterium]
MKKVIILNKKEGETPLSALENFRKKNPKYFNIPITYAGRLDPMASGVLVLLAGEEAKNKEKYLALDKEYNFSVLFGFSTDTYDILGKVVERPLGNEFFSLLDNDSPLAFAHQRGLTQASAIFPLRGTKQNCLQGTLRIHYLASGKNLFGSLIKKNLKYFKGKLKQKYPIYSSKTVKGKPLFSYARSGEDVEIPERNILIKKINLEKIRKINNKKLLENIEKRIKKVKGDFRQKEILRIWKKKLCNRNIFYVADFRIKCTSGTYMRAIANSLGEKIGIPALAFSIKRTKLGKFSI